MSRPEAAEVPQVEIAEKVRGIMLEKLVREALARAPQGTSVGGDWLLAMAEAVWESGQAAKDAEAARIKGPTEESSVCSRCGGTRRVHSALGGVATAIEGPCPECGPKVSAVDLAKTFATFNGKREGIRLYAWWKDGTQYVGSCGRTLEEALADIDREEDAAIAALQGPGPMAGEEAR